MELKEVTPTGSVTEPSVPEEPPALPARDDESIKTTIIHDVEEKQEEDEKAEEEEKPPPLPSRHHEDPETPKLPPRRNDSSLPLTPVEDRAKDKKWKHRISSLASDFQFTGFGDIQQRSLSGVPSPVEFDLEEVQLSKWRSDPWLFGFVTQLDLVDDYLESLRDSNEIDESASAPEGWERTIDQLEGRSNLDHVFQLLKTMGPDETPEMWFTRSYMSTRETGETKWKFIDNFAYDGKIKAFLQFALGNITIEAVAFRIIRSVEHKDPRLLVETLKTRPELAKELTEELPHLDFTVNAKLQKEIVLRGIDVVIELVVSHILAAQKFEVAIGSAALLKLPHYGICSEWQSLRHGIEYPEKTKQGLQKLKHKQAQLIKKKEQSGKQYNDLLNNYQQLNEEKFHNERLIEKLKETNTELKAKLAVHSRELNSMLANFEVIKVNNERNTGIAKINVDLGKEVGSLQREVNALKGEISKYKK